MGPAVAQPLHHFWNCLCIQLGVWRLHKRSAPYTHILHLCKRSVHYVKESWTVVSSWGWAAFHRWEAEPQFWIDLPHEDLRYSQTCGPQPFLNAGLWVSRILDTDFFYKEHSGLKTKTFSGASRKFTSVIRITISPIFTVTDEHFNIKCRVYNML